MRVGNAADNEGTEGIAIGQGFKGDSNGNWGNKDGVGNKDVGGNKDFGGNEGNDGGDDGGGDDQGGDDEGGDESDKVGYSFDGDCIVTIVKMPGGTNTHTTYVELADTIDKIEAFIKNKTGTQKKHQRLVLKDDILLNARTMQEYNVQHMSSLELLIHGIGGGKRAPGRGNTMYVSSLRFTLVDS